MQWTSWLTTNGLCLCGNVFCKEIEMKTYEVELRRTSYIIVTVEANDKDEAEAEAWKRVEADHVNINDAQWDIESIEETEEN